MYVFAFDRDLTVDSSPDPGPVPLDWVKAIAGRHETFAVGNPLLGPEAGIRTKDQVKDLCKQQRLQITIPSLDLSKIRESHRSNAEGKIRRLARLSALYPDAGKIVIDDIDLSVMPMWLWISPTAFVAAGLAHWTGLPR